MRRIVRFAIVVCVCIQILGEGAVAQDVGPPNGSLVVVGGGMRSSEIVDRFVQLAGGPHAHIVVIPTAGGAESYDQSFGGLRPFHQAGVRNLTLLHTYDREEAEMGERARPTRRPVVRGGGSQSKAAASSQRRRDANTKGDRSDTCLSRIGLEPKW